MTHHIPILLKPITEALIEPFLALSPDSTPHLLVDCTLGGGGHTAALLEVLEKNENLKKHRVLSIDQDPEVIARAQKKFASEITMGRLEIFHAHMSQLSKVLEDRENSKKFPVLGLLADLGFSSDQLENAERGISFQKEGPLDMRMDPTRGESCFEFLSRASETEIARVIFELGEERFSRRIASNIVRSREAGELPQTTKGLSELIVRAIPSDKRHGKIHAATRTFQALRIHVNQELEELDALLAQATPSLTKGGRVAIISFHSLEDRKVKQAFKNPDFGLRPLTKKPIEASREEIQTNPRARSAKLRIAERKP